METELEHILTNSYKSEMISYMKSHPEDFDEAIQLALANNQPYSWRAAWLLWSVMEDNDIRVQSHLNSLFKNLTSYDDNQLRELLIVLQRMDLYEESLVILFDFCLGIWKKVGKNASLRYHSFKLMVKIAKIHPEFFLEIHYLTETIYMETLSDTVKKSVFKMTKGLMKE